MFPSSLKTINTEQVDDHPTAASDLFQVRSGCAVCFSRRTSLLIYQILTFLYILTTTCIGNRIKLTLKPLPVDQILETRAVLNKTASAHRYLAELKGMATAICPCVYARP
jgi:hypothetical protein